MAGRISRKLDSESGLAKDFFDEPENRNGNLMFKCKLCGVCKNSNKISNLASHLKTTHHTVYVTEIKKQIEYPLTKLKIERLKLLQNCVEMTTVNKQPFADLLKSGFQKIIAHQLEEFEKNGIALDLKSRNLTPVKEHIRHITSKIRAMIQDEMKNMMISITADVATKNNRSIFGLHAQYILNGKLIHRCLGMIGMHDRHTGKYMSDLLRDCLGRYEAGFDNIVSATTDNASNMRAMVLCMNEHPEDEAEECSGPNQRAGQIPDTNIVDDIAIDIEIADFVDNGSDELQALLDNLTPEEDEWTLANYDDNWLEHIQHNHHFLINGVNCAAHTLQLAVRDAIAQITSEPKNVIKLCKMFAKFTRLQKTIYELKKKGIRNRYPPLDVCTRWSSTYLMVI